MYPGARSLHRRVKRQNIGLECDIIYNLDDFDLKQIDQYLWQFGKDVFPKQYTKKEKGVPLPSSTTFTNNSIEASENLIARFNSDMESIYYTASKLGYKPSYFLQMVQSMNGYEAAKKLIYAKDPSSGLARLWELQRLDLSVEAHILKPEYYSLFTDDERRLCAERLASFGYNP